MQHCAQSELTRRAVLGTARRIGVAYVTMVKTEQNGYVWLTGHRRPGKALQAAGMPQTLWLLSGTARVSGRLLRFWTAAPQGVGVPCTSGEAARAADWWDSGMDAEFVPEPLPHRLIRKWAGAIAGSLEDLGLPVSADGVRAVLEDASRMAALGIPECAPIGAMRAWARAAAKWEDRQR